MRRALRGIVGALWLVAGCGRVNVASDDINGFKTDDNDQAFFGFVEGFGADFDGDGTNDAVAKVTIVLTDSPTFCEDLNNFAVFGNLGLLGDVQFLSIDVDLLEANSDGPALVDNLTVEGAAVDVEFTVLEDGGQLVTAEDADTSTLEIKGVRDGRLRGEITSVLNFNDGPNVLTANVSGTFSAERCTALDALALFGF
jgi:hypothetical protein